MTEVPPTSPATILSSAKLEDAEKVGVRVVEPSWTDVLCDALWGLFLLAAGAAGLFLFFSLVGSSFWPLLLIGGFLWLGAPLLVFAGGYIACSSTMSLFKRA